MLPGEDSPFPSDADDFGNLEPAVVDSWHYCRTQYLINPKHRVWSYRIRLGIGETGVHAIQKLTRDIFHHVPFHFKCQISFVSLLRNRVTHENRIFFASLSNFGVFKTMRLIKGHRSRMKALADLGNLPIEVYLANLEKPNSRWVLERLVAMNVFVVKL